MLVSRAVDLHDGVQQRRPVVRRQQVVVGEQGLCGRADAGERSAQVVGDGREQCRTGAVAGLELARRLGLPGQLLALAQHAEV